MMIYTHMYMYIVSLQMVILLKQIVYYKMIYKMKKKNKVNQENADNVTFTEYKKDVPNVTQEWCRLRN